MSITKVTRNYQITVPLDIRGQAKINEGDKLIITMENNEIRVKKLSEDNIFDKAFGSWKSVKVGVEYVRSIRKGWGKRIKRLGI